MYYRSLLRHTRRSLRPDSSRLSKRGITAASSSKGPFGIVFDIDGVLVRGGKPLPGAFNVLEYLGKKQQHKDIHRRIPYLFMTNGGGVLEEIKAQEISDVFFPGLPQKIRASQVQLSHTPMKALLSEYKDKQILVREFNS